MIIWVVLPSRLEHRDDEAIAYLACGIVGVCQLDGSELEADRECCYDEVTTYLAYGIIDVCWCHKAELVEDIIMMRPLHI